MSASFKFVHLSDTHVRPDEPSSSRIFADHLDQIAVGDYAFVIHSGDLMEEPSAWAARAFRTMVSTLPIPVYAVPGNHDIYNPHMGGIEAPWWARLAVDSRLEAQYRALFGPNWYSFSHDGVGFVALDSPVINSGLPEEHEQWDWLERTLADFSACRPDHLLLFTHLPLFVRHPYEELSPTDFRNRYLVLAPPGRDRLLGLIRRHRVDAVLTGHFHAPWEISHAWPEGFTTRFITTASSGPVSPMAIQQFDLPLEPDQGLGFHEHRISSEGLSSSYRQHRLPSRSDQWHLGEAWLARCPEGKAPTRQPRADWTAPEYLPETPEWQSWRATPALVLPENTGMQLFVRQSFVAETDAADVYLELSTGREAHVYLNGTLLYELAPLGERPSAWRSAVGTWTIDGPAMSLGVSQRLVRKGENVLAVRVGAEESSVPGSNGGDYIALRRMEGTNMQNGLYPGAVP